MGLVMVSVTSKKGEDLDNGKISDWVELDEIVIKLL